MSSSTTDVGSGGTDSGSDAAVVTDLGTDLGADLGTDLGVADAASTDGGGEPMVEMPWEGPTPITTIHSSLAGGYVPQHIAVNVGDVVKWVNDDGDIDHTVWSTGFAPSLSAGENFCLRFTTPGMYDYYCYFHSTMTGSVQVNP